MEQHNKNGRTPLIEACSTGAGWMASFLLDRRANPSTEHRDAALRPGHFMADDKNFIEWEQESGLHRREVTKLLVAAFKISEHVNFLSAIALPMASVH